MFLFVGVSLFFFVSICNSIGTRTASKKKWTKTKSGKYTIVVTMFTLRAFFSCCFFVVNTSNRSISFLRILFDYLILALVLYIDSRPNVLVVLHHGKLSFFFRYSKRFLPSLHLFTFDTWMNEHQIGWSLFVGVFPLEYRGLCLHRRQQQ